MVLPRADMINSEWSPTPEKLDSVGAQFNPAVGAARELHSLELQRQRGPWAFIPFATSALLFEEASSEGRHYHGTGHRFYLIVPIFDSRVGRVHLCLGNLSTNLPPACQIPWIKACSCNSLVSPSSVH